MFLEAKQLQKIDHKLIDLLINYKMTGNSTSYIWRTQDDGKVRDSHAANDDQIFLWNNRPATGHPGEDFNCRCWAEPIGDSFYANQLLITKINDNPNKWGNRDFIDHYRTENNGDVTLAEIGHFAGIIDYFANKVETSDGSKGGYQAVEKQIIDEAIIIRNGVIDYDFSDSYEFGDFWDLFLFNGRYSFGDSIVGGVFDGDVRTETVNQIEYLVINGIMKYKFEDRFSDPFQLIEITDRIPGINRQEAEEIVGDNANRFGKPYKITGTWQTKFNATVSVNGQEE